MPRESQTRFVRESLRRLIDTLHEKELIDRGTHANYLRFLRRRSALQDLTRDLHNPHEDVPIPGYPGARLVLLKLKEPGGRNFSLLAFKPATLRRRRLRCLVGHRFAKRIEGTFRWNLRQLFELFGIKVEYSGFDGAATHVIQDLIEMIRRSDFCLFDNRETTNPSKPNVYIEAGIALALNRPFIFTHYRKEIWPSDFSNVNYMRYESYKELFEELYAKLPIFLAKKVSRRRHYH